MGFRISVDTGGTFTDVALIDEQTGEMFVTKVPSTPDNPSKAVLSGVERILDQTRVKEEDITFFIHGTTVATNALLEQKGARTALITTEGFKDVLQIGRQTRPNLYDFRARKRDTIIPRHLRLEVSERMKYNGDVITPLLPEQFQVVLQQLKDENVDSVAVCLINSYANDRHERMIKQWIQEELPNLYVTLSCEVLPEYREYERMSTTVCNAYVLPKMNSYIGHLRDELKRKRIPSDLYIMQSNGGVITAETAMQVSARTVLSGPAGGAMYSIATSEMTGRQNLITIDMGGTSLDICLVEGGKPQYTTTNEIGGHPIKLPMIEIHTIGSGGGSIAWIDSGGALRVGPQSAGARPGPVCYGHGGTEPTVSDANVVLGRLNPDSILGGEMKMDMEAARAVIQEKIAAPLGITVEEAAQGILWVVNANMVRGIRVVSVEKGHDPREFSLVAFGGAGPLHAVDLGIELGSSEVIIPPNPGITCAIGMLTADIRHDYVKTLMVNMDHLDLPVLNQTFSHLEDEAVQQLMSEGFSVQDISLERSLDLRYERQSYELSIPVAGGQLNDQDISNAISGLHSLHEKLYGYSRKNEKAELVNVRLVATGELSKVEFEIKKYAEHQTLEAVGYRKVYFNGAFVETPIYDRSKLNSHIVVHGPAIIEQLDTTIVVYPGQKARSDRYGNLMIDLQVAQKEAIDNRQTKIDSITVEVMKNGLQSIAEEMGVTLIRTALSSNIKDRMDCSTAVYTKTGKLVAQAEHIPLHLGLMPSVVEETLKIYPPDQLQEGDAILINDPYISGSHLPDIFIITPVFYEGALVAILGNIAHHTDVGGITPGSMSVAATEIFQEGLRVPGIRIRKAGVIDEEILRFMSANVRIGRDFQGDLYAQLAASNVGELRLQELFARYSVHFVEKCMEEIMEYSNRRMRAAILEVPNGVYTFEDYLDGDGIHDEPIKIMAQVIVEDEEIIVDFEGTSKQVKGPVNSTNGVTNACVYYAIKAFLDPEVPPNAGAYRAVHVKAPLGTVVNPKFPAAVSNANTNTSQRIADVILGALATVLPEKAMAACSGTMNLFAIGGLDEDTGEYFSYIETYGGGQGATLGLDGMDAVHTNMTNTRNTPTEVIEQTYPLTVKRYALAEDTGGIGQYRGGMGMIREVVVEADDAAVTLSTERKKIGPWGLFGGGKGRTSQCLLITPDGKQIELVAKVTMRVQKGSRIILKTSGGGGYMDPLERNPQDVQKDVLAGNISMDTARKEYGVIFDRSPLNVNKDETVALRLLIKGN